MRIIGKEQAIREGGKTIYENTLLRTGSVQEAKQDQAEFVQIRQVQEDKPKKT